jgi:hypothetical protein
LIEAVLGPKYEDDEELTVTDWDGTIQLACTCGWIDARIYSSAGSLPKEWREHVMAERLDLDHRGRPR